jgi:nitrogen fixation protein FixH
MRVRPFFWCLLVFSCVSVLTFAATTHVSVPAIMQVQIEQPPRAVGFTTMILHLMDPQGLPIDEAQIVPSARMTNMDMATHEIRVKEVGQGQYMAQLHLYMAGPWEITVMAQADGFAPLHQSLLVQVIT